MSSAGAKPTAKRIIATCDPDSRAEASFALNAISPKNVADAIMSSKARRTSCGAFAIVTRRRISMSDVQYRDATPSDATSIVDFQIAMAHETEDVDLDRHTVIRGVDAVFNNPSLGRYYVAEAAGEVVASLLITYEWSDWRNGMVWW